MTNVSHPQVIREHPADRMIRGLVNEVQRLVEAEVDLCKVLAWWGVTYDIHHQRRVAWGWPSMQAAYGNVVAGGTDMQAEQELNDLEQRLDAKREELRALELTCGELRQQRRQLIRLLEGQLDLFRDGLSQGEQLLREVRHG